jgi:hypothetical protein
MSGDTVKFALGDVVYHRTGDGQAGIVTAIVYREIGVVYEITWGRSAGEVENHYACELQRDKPEKQWAGTEKDDD